MDEIGVSPMAKLPRPKVPEKAVPVIGADNLKRLFRVVSGADFGSRRDKAIISLFIDTGMRLSEMAGINIEYMITTTALSKSWVRDGAREQSASSRRRGVT
jgi:site-specific recombinase XerC